MVITKVTSSTVKNFTGRDFKCKHTPFTWIIKAMVAHSTPGPLNIIKHPDIVGTTLSMAMTSPRILSRAARV